MFSRKPNANVFLNQVITFQPPTQPIGGSRYRLSPTGFGSDRFGCCEICKKPADSIFVQTREQRYMVQEGDTKTMEGFNADDDYGGWSVKETLFGHRECLICRRVPGSSSAIKISHYVLLDPDEVPEDSDAGDFAQEIAIAKKLYAN